MLYHSICLAENITHLCISHKLKTLESPKYSTCHKELNKSTVTVPMKGNATDDGTEENSKVLYSTSKILQRYFESTPRYHESTVRYLVKECKGTSVVSRSYLSCTSKADGNTMLRRPKRVATVHW